MKKTILGKKLLFVIAHPDDESFLAAGTINANHNHNGSNYILCATMGERGHSYMNYKVSTSHMCDIRKKELVTVSKYLGVCELKILDLPDGSIHSHTEKLEKRLIACVLKSKPDYIISFGEDGYTGHADHIILGHVAKNVARNYTIPFIQFAKPPYNMCPTIDKHLIAKRKNGVYKHTSIKNIKPNIQIKIDPFVKLKALSLHTSQFGGLNFYNIFPIDIADHLVNYEYFFIS